MVFDVNTRSNEAFYAPTRVSVAERPNEPWLRPKRSNQAGE